jgi:hypothetical protein
MRLALLVAVACGGSPPTPPPSPPPAPADTCDACVDRIVQRPTGSPEYSTNPQLDYERGAAALDAGDLVLAIKYLAFLTKRFADSEYAGRARELVRDRASVFDERSASCSQACRAQCATACRPDACADGCTFSPDL